jgi:hypothetical protein
MNLTVEICAVLGYYAASCGDCLPTFRENVSVPSSRVKKFFWFLKMGPIRCSETSVNNYHTTLRNIPEESRSHQHRIESLKSRLELKVLKDEFGPERCSPVWQHCPLSPEDPLTGHAVRESNPMTSKVGVTNQWLPVTVRSPECRLDGTDLPIITRTGSWLWRQ